MGRLQPVLCSVVSTWKRCMCAQVRAYAEGLLVSKRIRAVRQLCGAPQASLTWVPKSSTVIITCIYKMCAYSGSGFAEIALPSMKWRQSIQSSCYGGV